MRVKVGCCGFPKARTQYYKFFNLVEIQQTFYQPPQIRTAERWRQEAPGEFEFTIKAWQLITHEAQSPTYRRLKFSWTPQKLSACGSFKPTKEVHFAWQKTKEIAAVLGAKVIVFQTPASFFPSPANLANLRNFFREISRDDFIFVWEPRGKWKKEDVQRLCQELNLIHGVDPFKAEAQYGEIFYYRLHGITGYRYRFTEDDLRTLKDKTSGVGYCLFNNVNMWADALNFQKIIAEIERAES